MEHRRVNIIGAGPAGASLAFYLKDSGYKVTIFNSQRKPGLKPCGWAVPASIKNLLPLPSDYIISRIRGHRVFIDDRLVMEEETDRDWGYIINKPAWLEYLIRESGAIYRNESVRGKIPYGTNVIATGVAWEKAPKERINAVQVLIDNIDWPYTDRVEVWFYTSFVGYFWVFPHNEKRIDVGVGGYGEFTELKEMLYSFINKHPIISMESGKKIGVLKGAQLVATGIVPELLIQDENTFVTGEAAGGVYPLSGEGIRPSVMMSKALADHLLGRKNYLEGLKENGLLLSMRIHRLLLDILRSLSSEQRLELMRSIPREWVVRFGLGDFTMRSLLEMIVTYRGNFTKVIASLLKAMVKKEVQ